MSDYSYKAAAQERIVALNAEVEQLYLWLSGGATEEDSADRWDLKLESDAWAYEAIEKQRARIRALNINLPGDATTWAVWAAEADSVARELGALSRQMAPRTAGDLVDALKETVGAPGGVLEGVKDTAKWGAIAVVALLTLVVFVKVS